MKGEKFNSSDFEIRLNPLGDLGNCSICNRDDEGYKFCSNKIGEPDLFLSNQLIVNGWVCYWCADDEVPELFSLILLARQIEGYNLVQNFDIFDYTKESEKKDSYKYQIALKFNIYPTSIDYKVESSCGICNEMTVFEIAEKFKKPRFNFYFRENVICIDCIEKYAKELDKLESISHQAIEHGKRILFENKTPVKKAKLDDFGWLTCPSCNKRFAIKSKHSWNYNRHITCGQKIELILK